MALTTPAFEMDDDNSADTGAEQTTKTLTADERVAAAAARQTAKAAETKAAETKPAAETPAVSASTAVAAVKPNALVTSMTQANPFKALENAIKVDYNTLHRIMVSNGNVMSKELKGKEALMGETCELDLISTQKHWVMAPGGEQDDEESLQYLKYSDDGKTERETGRPLTEFLELAVKAGYTKARINERVILVGELLDAGKLNDTLKGELVQLDLAPRSVKNFNTHTVNVAFKVAKGRIPAEGATRLKVKAAVQSKDKLNWTDAEFEVGSAA